MSGANDFVIENGTLRKYTGPGGDVVILKGVTTIEYSAFSACTSLSSVVIPEGVTEIGEDAFDDDVEPVRFNPHGSAELF